MQITDEDEFLKQVLKEYFPNTKETPTFDVLTLYSIKNWHNERKRCFSMKNEKVNKDWKRFLNGLPLSKDEIIPSPQDRFWRWKMFRQYVPEVKTDFRKKMKSGPHVDQFGSLPITGEYMHIYRNRYPHNHQKSNLKK